MTQPVKIDPDALYDDGSLSVALGLRANTIDKARKSGELRSTKRGGRPLYLGRWVHEWLTAEPSPDRELAGVA